ncbi:hypothetical protein PPERSA_06472 [Pseudocohnilembus persalinus]|uniref:Nucleoside 2-deoxyribosyltransferase like n=1 Tax=Pseudocohnilembus persalinus TaxID=266149 RepID=A0A0V0QRF3_PSEPJ|nr:hypothetical protein PPERSA_06472 [Pseudocohnilembus persalinus]|eukprot:KRX04838.1 hypothetical protein PPERSA_06472 [Pseudocohnilembus persalinus]
MKVQEIKAPNRLFFKKNDIKIFLAGSIEQGKAEDWQQKVVKYLQDEKKFKDLGQKQVIILNPRRDSWDPNLEQNKNNKEFSQQVYWELNALEAADIIVMYFQPGTQSPISLLELGLFAKSKKLIVLCPEGFWRKGNVDIVSQAFQITQVSDFDNLMRQLKIKIAIVKGKKQFQNFFLLASSFVCVLLLAYVLKCMFRL